jgi:D-3-phosphoglycerate dehydrogenase
MSKKVLLCTEKPFTADAVSGIEAILKEAKYELVKLEKYKEQSELLAAVKDVDAMIIRSDLVHEDVMDAGKDSLKLVVRAGAGVDNIDLKAAATRNLTCMNTPGANANAVAELAFGMMIQNARNHWDGSSGYELKGKTLALYGYGAVARSLHTIAKAFEMEVSAYDPFLKPEQIKAGGATPLTKVEDLFKSQFVSLHVPSTPETNNSINFDLISKMPKNAVLINTSRPEVVDEAGLKKVLDSRKDFAYLTDVPPKTKAELQKVENGTQRVFVTAKKMGAQTSEANNNAGVQAANQIVAFFEKGDLRGQVKA